MIQHVRKFVIPAAYELLPPAMASERATAMLMAIGWQESRFAYRHQVNGPAKGFWQFEQGGGVAGVLRHRETKELARKALVALAYPHEPTPYGVHVSLEHNDVLACVFARLLLWTVPDALPGRAEPEAGWTYYRLAWRPGKPHEATWSQSWATGWN